jgi:hypothetical protein
MNDHNPNNLAKSNNQLTQSQPNSIGVKASKQEVEIFVAQQGKTLETFKNKEMNDLKNSVVKWIYMLGMTGKVSDKDIIANTQIIAELFPKLTLEQLNLSIKLSLQGVLDVDVETYGSFSPMYISKIIKAYLTYSNSKIKEINWRKMSFDQMETKQIEEPYSVRLEWRKKQIAYYINHILTRNEYIGDYKDSMWEMLKRLNALIPTELPLEEAERWAKDRSLLESQTIEAKQYARLTPKQRKEKLEVKQKMYSRFYVMRYFFKKMQNHVEWLKSLEDETILPQ